MYNDLVKRLRESVENRDEKCDCCPYEEDYPCCVDCLDKMHREAADAIEELSANMDIARSIATIIENEKDMRVIAQTSRWIPVTERLPEKDGNYLVAVKCPRGKWVEICACDGRDWVSVDEYAEYATKWVTHWMPLPQPPKEVDT